MKKNIKGAVRVLVVCIIAIICISTNSKAMESGLVSEGFKTVLTVNVNTLDSETARTIGGARGTKNNDIYKDEIIADMNYTAIEEYRNALKFETDKNLHEDNWFYNQLTELEKCIYNGLYNNREDIINGQEVSFFIAHCTETEINQGYYRESILRARSAYLAEHPVEKIWMDNCECKLTYIKNGDIRVLLQPKEEKDISGAIETLERKADEIVQSLYGTEVEKLQQIHNWLVANVEYDLTAPNAENLYGAIIDRHCICSGYAYAFKYLANKVGINVIYVRGQLFDARNNVYGYHAWNMVFIDGQWKLVDVTTDKASDCNEFFLSSTNTGIHYLDPLFSYPL